MISITLHSKSGRPETIDFPEKWNELTTKDLEAIARVLLLVTDSVYAAKAELFITLLQRRSKLPNLERRINVEDYATQAHQLCNFIYESNTLTRQPYPTLQVGKRILYGLEDDFTNITCGEYDEAFIEFVHFKTTEDVAHLHNLAAILYRPKDVPFWDYRAHKDESIMYRYDVQAKLFARLPAPQLYTIFMWFSGCQALLQELFPTVYEGDGSSSEPDVMAFTKCIHAAAGPKNGSRNQIRRMKLMELLFDMEQEAIKAKQLQAQYDAQKPQ